MFRQDWADQPEGTVPVLEGICAEDQIHDVPIVEPGSFEVWPAVCTAHDRATSIARAFTPVLPWVLQISTEDVERQQSILYVPQQAIFEVIALRDAVPVPLQKMVFHSEMRSSEVTSDASGAAFLLDDPAGFVIEAGSGLTVGVKRLV